MRNNNILKTIMIVLFAGAIVFGVYWLTNNSKKVVDSMNGTNIYTYEDVQKSYSDGYNTALENKSEYDTLIASYRDTITTLNNNINTLNGQITTLQNTITNKNGDISSLETQITTLQTQKSNLESQITTLQGYIASLQSEIDNVYNYSYTLDITYIVDGQDYAYGKARSGGSILVPPTAPTKSGYIFTGWSLTANGTVIDIMTATFNQNTTLYAVFTIDVTYPSFFIDDVECYFEEGMTWAEWIDSEFNLFDIYDANIEDYTRSIRYINDVHVREVLIYTEDLGMEHMLGYMGEVEDMGETISLEIGVEPNDLIISDMFYYGYMCPTM